MSKVNHPDHYNIVPDIECIDVVEHFSFNRGNAIKYLWRAGAKDHLIQDLQKAIWYINREIEGLTNDPNNKQWSAVPAQEAQEEEEVGCDWLAELKEEA